MFAYNIAKTADGVAFKNACALIERGVAEIKKEDVLVDVDGSVIQVYTTPHGKIKVANDLEVDAVYADSEINLDALGLSKEW